MFGRSVMASSTVSTVAVMEMQIARPSMALVRDGTLIVAGAYAPAGEADLLAFADALRPVAVEDIHWER